MDIRRPNLFRAHLLCTAAAIVLFAIAAPASAQQARMNVSGMQAEGGYDRLIVKYQDDSDAYRDGALMRRSLDRAATTFGRSRAIDLQHLRRTATGAEVIRVDRKLDRVEMQALMRQIGADPSVEYVEIDQVNQAQIVPDDPRYSEQWGLSGAPGIRANQAWDVTSGSGTVVAVLDTGIVDHSDLDANVLPGYDFIADIRVSNDGDGRDSDASDPGDWISANQCGGIHRARASSWHGTHVAGTIAAVTNNARGVAGVAHGARIVPVRVLGTCGGFDSDITDAIIWASGGAVSGVPVNANPAEVINLSLGDVADCGFTFQRAIDEAVGRGTTIVTGANNVSSDVAGFRPANCNNVIVVAAVTDTGARASFSNHGSMIDIAAPGSGIVSTANSGATTPGTETYTSYNGTSTAAPHVSGVAALIQSVATTPRTPAQVEALIKGNVTAFPSTPSRPVGPGILSAKAAVDAANGPTPSTAATGLDNGVVATRISGSVNSEQMYSLYVPAGASGLRFTTRDGVGDADLYVRFGGVPTPATYDCRSASEGNNETCDIAATKDGTYYVLLRGNSAFGAVSLTGSYSGGGAQTYRNNADYPIYDHASSSSPITVSSRWGGGPKNASVTFDIEHTYQGDLRVQLLAPDGSIYDLHERNGSHVDNLSKTVSLNLSRQAIKGTWMLRVYDNAGGDVGYLKGWSMTL